MLRCTTCIQHPPAEPRRPMADPKPKPTSKTKRKASSAGPSSASSPAPDWLAEVQQLSYQQAQTALELCLAQLQSSELEVEEMAGIYRRAEAYGDRCEAVLSTVQQEVIEWSA